jgi:Protein of unknown function (DUF4240)
MDTGQFWELIADARAEVADPADSEAVAAQATALLSVSSREEIVAAQRALSGLMAASYRHTLWAAASLINGGCGDDGFGYFRGWLITQGRAVFERSVADPDTLADLPGTGPPGPGRQPTECEEALYIPMSAYKAATGDELPADAFTVWYPDLESSWDFDFTDRAKMERWLPRLTALCWPR